MVALTTSRSGLNLVASFTPPSNNGASISAYEIQIWKPSTSTYVTDSTYCDGASAPVISATSCTFAFLYLISDYGYVRGQLVTFRARAQNDDGWGDYSNVNSAGATVMTVPTTMGALSEGAATSSTQVEVTWSALTTTEQTGASPITSYQLEWDNNSGGSTWTDIAGVSSPYTSTSFVKTGVTAGATYQFRIRAQNALGVGGTSSVLSVIPSSPPSQMTAATTSMESVYLKIAWDAPNDNGAAITAYKVLIKAANGTYLEET